MSFYVFTTADCVHYRHCDAPLSVAILDDTMRPVGKTFEPLADDFDSAETFVAGLFVIGYWSTADLKLFDLNSGEERASFPFRNIETPTFDETGSKLLFRSASRVFLLDIKTAEATQVKGVRAIDRRVTIKGKNHVIVASQKKGELVRVSLQTGTVSVIPLPIDATFFDLKQNPVTRDIVLIDRKKGVHCIDTSTWDIRWSVSLTKELGKHHMGVGQFSGDGRLFGAAVAAYDHNYMVVLDAETGKISRRIDRVCNGLPWQGGIIRDNWTKSNTFVADALDLSTGAQIQVCLAPPQCA